MSIDILDQGETMHALSEDPTHEPPAARHLYAVSSMGSEPAYAEVTTSAPDGSPTETRPLSPADADWPSYFRIQRDPQAVGYGQEIVGDPTRIRTTVSCDQRLGTCPRCGVPIIRYSAVLAAHMCYGGPWYVYPLRPF